MSGFLAPTRYIDSDHPAIQAFAREKAKGATALERAVSLYYAVRDGIRYNPFIDYTRESAYRASGCLAEGEGYCVGKAALLAACARAVGIPARLGLADVKNHLTTPALRERMGTDLFVYHGYTDLLLESRWVKATPAFNIELCRKFRVKPLEFDGREDSIFHPFDEDDRRHMEYVQDRGTHEDVPVAEIMDVFRRVYPSLIGAPQGAQPSFG